jgi:hypothetical protein
MSGGQGQLASSARSIIKTALATICGLILCSAAKATTQILDEIEFDGRSWPLSGDEGARLPRKRTFIRRAVTRQPSDWLPRAMWHLLILPVGHTC